MCSPRFSCLSVGPLSKYHSQALVFYKPKRIAINGGYFGCHASIDVYRKAKESGLDLIGLDDEFRPGDLCWVETPLNPTGESRCVCLIVAVIRANNCRRDIQYYADKVPLLIVLLTLSVDTPR